jgi:hypothetical protein
MGTSLLRIAWDYHLSHMQLTSLFLPRCLYVKHDSLVMHMTHKTYSKPLQVLENLFLHTFPLGQSPCLDSIISPIF